jgi:hypothetical protein
MASLTAHLREPDAHAGLPFHPECPICRCERLVGTFASGEFVSLRTQAALAASVLALGTTAPAALAAEQDSEHEGASSVAQTVSNDPSQNPSFDPGGNAETLPQAPAGPQNPAPPTPGNDDGGPIEQQSATNTNDPVVDNGDGQDKGQPQTQQTPQTPQTPQTQPTPQSPPMAADQGATPPSTADASPAPPTPADAAPAADAPSTAPEPDEPIPTGADETGIGGTARGASLPQRPRRHASHRAERKAVRHTQPVGGGTGSPPAPSSAATSTPSPQTAEATTTTTAGDAKPGDSTHRVHAGESLWSIASDVLGPSASPARIAREVHRLWQLNRERIGTGNPDLVMVGTALRLR